MKLTLVTSVLALLVSSSAVAQEFYDPSTPADSEKLVDADVAVNYGVPLEVEPAPTVESTQPMQSEPVVEQVQTQPVIEEPVVIAQPLPPIVVVKPTTKIALYGAVAPVAKERNKYVGMTWGLGTPTGMSLGLSIRPAIQWAHADILGTTIGLAHGIAGSVTLDPINFGIAPTITGEIGRVFEGSIPGKDVKFSYDHASVLGGLEFGSRRGFRFFLRSGFTWINVKVKGLQSIMPSDNNADITFTDPTLKARFAPTVRLGFTLFF